MYCSAPTDAYWQPFEPANPPPRYSRKDLLIAFASTHDRLAIVLASRAWRQGVKTFVFMDEPLDPKRAPAGLVEGIKAHNEIYDHFPQPQSRPGTWSQPGDARYHRCSCRISPPSPFTHASKGLLDPQPFC